MNTLFPDEEMLPKIDRPKKQKNVSYEDFVAKFDHSAKKTTDDCYTPQEVYNAVLNWVCERCDIAQRPIIRPFYPGGDYINEKYPVNCVVVDNPPFSILTRIVRFYVAHRIDFFLFAPTLSLFSTAHGSPICYIVAGASVVYHNNAEVNTSFVTNLFPVARVIVSPSLRAAIEKQNYQIPKPLSRNIALPKNVITAARLTKYTRGEDLIIAPSEVHPVKKIGKDSYNLFGGGFLISDAAVEKLATNAPAKSCDKLCELTLAEQIIIEKLNNSSK